jgi:tRNA-2-methylthio-N6-dimethylallyladenosine synthase
VNSYHIWTIGCQMNTADSERLAGALEQLGLRESPSIQEADVIVLNSCVVRQSAEDKVVSTLGLAKHVKNSNSQRIVALMGCMVGPKTHDLERRFPFVDAFMRPQEYGPLLRLLGNRLGVDAEGCLGTLVPPKPSISAHIPVIHGCDKFCTFCIIPYRRGREISRPIEEIVDEAEALVRRGVKEVTLLGQNVDSYGHDLPGNPDLADLLSAVNQVNGLYRIRFLTSHPNDMSPRIVHAVRELQKVCEHINLPFQAGDDQVLENMRRGYTSKQYRTLVKNIRDTMPGVSITTDLIIGFPGETQERFQRSLDMLLEVQFDKVHVAAYSERTGTIASRKLEDDVSKEDKKVRLRTVEEIQKVIASQINEKYKGERLEVLVDGRQKGKWRGRTRSDKLVFFQDDADLLGKLVRVKIEHTSPWSLRGALAKEPTVV